MEIFNICGLNFTYPTMTSPALSDINLTIEKGDFFVLCGYSGSGKSTLLRCLKPSLSPVGTKSGSISFLGKDISAISKSEDASLIGFVSQNPDEMIVTDKVWHELAFGLESLGIQSDEIRRRVAEMASYFGISDWFYKKTSELSGGQKQLLNLASVMVTGPDVLILDEPTSQLDPVAAADFIATLRKINTELGTTVILSEHRLEDSLSCATKAAVTENGRITICGTVVEVGKYLNNNHSPMFSAMPSAMRVWGCVDTNINPPVSVNEGKRFLENHLNGKTISYDKKYKNVLFADTVLKAENLYFRYEKNLPDCVKDASLELKKGQFFCILGANGSGKTTLLKVLSGIVRPYRGSVSSDFRISMLPQQVQSLFLKKTVYEDLKEITDANGIKGYEADKRINEVINLCKLGGFESRHPFDLSGGEQQRAALAKVLLSNPDIILLDEPTKGFDAAFKKDFAGIIKALCRAGVSVLAVSHDIEFCAEYADVCGLFFDGQIISSSTPVSFFNENRFYTTPAIRMSKGLIENIVTADDIISALGLKTHTDIEDSIIEYAYKPSEAEKKIKKPLPLWRKAVSAISYVGAVIAYIFASKQGSLSDMLTDGGFSDKGIKQLIYYGLIIFLLFCGIISGSVKQEKQYSLKHKLTKRTKMSVVLILFLIPLTLFAGIQILDKSGYYILSSIIILECIIPFFAVFEGHKPNAKELTLIATLCALTVAGRSAFFMLPEFKPMLAMTIIAGIALGGETGFIVGAVSMLVSDLIFGAGPWMPWQMFSMGIIGFLAGILYQRGLLSSSRLSLSVFGAVSAIMIYGGIMNPAALLMWQQPETVAFQSVIAYYLTGFPVDCIHAAATFIFLWLISQPMLEKIDRIKTKYGLINQETL